jgi:hypothetical protein
MLNAIQKGVVTSSTQKRLVELEESKDELEVRIIKEEMKKPMLTREQILFWLYKFRNLNVDIREHRQRLIDTFINAVYLYDDKIVITFNYKDGSKTVKMRDLKKSFNSDLTAFGRVLSIPANPLCERICGFRIFGKFPFGVFQACKFSLNTLVIASVVAARAI